MNKEIPTIDPRTNALAKEINQEARNNPNSPYAGKFVGIVRGKIVAVKDDMQSVCKILDQVEPDRWQRFILEASADYDTPVEIW